MTFTGFSGLGKLGIGILLCKGLQRDTAPQCAKGASPLVWEWFRWDVDKQERGNVSAVFLDWLTRPHLKPFTIAGLNTGLYLLKTVVPVAMAKRLLFVQQCVPPVLRLFHSTSSNSK